MSVSRPQVRISIGGQPILGAVNVEIEQVSYFAADRFVVRFAVDPGLNGGWVFFSALTSQILSIELANEPLGYIGLLTGRIDNVRLDFKRSTATLTGRDLAAGLIDSEIAESFVNQTSSQIVAAIAARHGLTANVTATTTPVGQYYELDHARSGLGLNSHAGTEWNLLCWLALIEGFLVSVVGTTLNFGPASAVTPLVLSVQDCIELELDIATTIPAVATVKSWNSRSKIAVTQSTGPAPGPTTTLIRPNLTSQQAASLAANRLSMLAGHRTILCVKMPGELVLTPGASVSLTQTNTGFDQTFVVDTMRRSIDAERGFTQVMHAHAAY